MNLGLTVWISIALFAGTGISAFGQQKNVVVESESLSLPVEEGVLKGTLVFKNSDHPLPIVIFISGSGPTDRNGNSSGMQNNMFAMLADSLIQNDITSFRFDKRMIGESTGFKRSMEDTRFEHFVNDIKSWITYFEADDRFSDLFVLGHSLGALMGSVAVEGTEVGGFISAAGPGLPLHETMYRQLENQSPFFAQGAKPIIDSLAAGFRVKEVHPLLQGMFAASIQNYIISLYAEDPKKRYAALELPVLIIQGSTDIQVTTSDARLLHQHCPGSKLVIIEGMGHVLKDAPEDRLENIAVYNDPELPLNSQVVQSVVAFVLENR